MLRVWLPLYYEVNGSGTLLSLGKTDKGSDGIENWKGR